MFISFKPWSHEASCSRERIARATGASNRSQKWSHGASYSREFQPASNIAVWQLLSNHSHQYSRHLNQCCFVNLYDLNQWFSTFFKSRTSSVKQFVVADPTKIKRGTPPKKSTRPHTSDFPAKSSEGQKKGQPARTRLIFRP